MRADKRRDPVEVPFESGGFARLDKAEMAFRKPDCFVTRQGAEHRHSKCLDRRADKVFDGADLHPVQTTPAILRRGSKPAQPSTRAAAVCDCPLTSSTSRTGQPRAAAMSAANRPSRLSRHAVEKPHQAFADNQFGAIASGCYEARREALGHRPTVEIETLPAGRGGWKAGSM